MLRAKTKKVWRMAGGAGALMLGVWAVIAAAGWAGRLGWLVELPANFPSLIVMAAVLALLLGCWVWGRIGLLMGLIMFSVVLVMILQPRPVLGSEPVKGQTLKFATWNLLAGTGDPAVVSRWVEEEQPDVIAFVEITKELRDALSQRIGYPYSLGNARNGTSGMAVFSKVRIDGWERKPDRGSYGNCVLTWPDGRSCRLFVAHPVAPTQGTLYDERARFFRNLGTRVRGEKLPVIVLGDLNATPASCDFRAFWEESGLRVASCYQPSWHASLPRGLCIAIDHVLADPRYFSSVAACSGVSGAGSDHLPVMAEIGLR